MNRTLLSPDLKLGEPNFLFSSKNVFLKKLENMTLNIKGLLFHIKCNLTHHLCLISTSWIYIKLNVIILHVRDIYRNILNLSH